MVAYKCHLLLTFFFSFRRKRFPYYEIVGDVDRNTVVFKSGDDLFSVEELVAQLIQKAREFAEDSTRKYNQEPNWRQWRLHSLFRHNSDTIFGLSKIIQ